MINAVTGLHSGPESLECEPQKERRKRMTVTEVTQSEFIEAVLTDISLSDAIVDGLEERIVRLEELVASRGIRRLRVRRRLSRSLRESVRPFAGRSFTEARYEAVSTEAL